MIAYVLFLLAATPIFGVPVSETVQVEQVQKEHEAQHATAETFQGTPQTLSAQHPFGQPSYPNVPYYTRKSGESGAVEVPLTPDAIVIPYSYPSYPNYPNYQNYHYYPNVGSRNQSPAPYNPQFVQPYNQYPYVPESFLVVPVPNVQRVTPGNYVPEYENAPRLLYYLPKSYYPTGYQTPIHQTQQFQTQEKTQQQAVPKTVTGEAVVTQGEGVVPHGETVVETNKQTGASVEGSHHQ